MRTSGAVALGFKGTGSVVVEHGLNSSAACGIFPDWDFNPCLLHWQADTFPLSHPGSACANFYSNYFLEFLCSPVPWMHIARRDGFCLLL